MDVTCTMLMKISLISDIYVFTVPTNIVILSCLIKCTVIKRYSYNLSQDNTSQGSKHPNYKTSHDITSWLRNIPTTKCPGYKISLATKCPCLKKPQIQTSQVQNVSSLKMSHASNIPNLKTSFLQSISYSKYQSY
jgi:hypothetical protein